MIVDKPMLGAPTFILIGGTLTLSMLDIGFQLTKSYGFFAALCSILLGNILLTCIAFPVARIAFATGLNTVELTTRIFGNKNGKYLFSIIMAALMICWAAIQLDFISVNLKLIVTQYTNYSINPIFFSIIFGILTMSFVLYGISKLNTLSKILLIPIIAIFLLFIKMSSAIQGNFSFYFPELSIVIAVMFGLFIDLPTFLCIVPSWKEAKKILI
jgi:cytosine permease